MEMDQSLRPMVYCARCEYGEHVPWDEIGAWSVDHDRHRPAPDRDPDTADDAETAPFRKV